MLDADHADLARVTTAWADQWWDDDVGLLWMPPDPVDGAYPDPVFHCMPQTAWYAVGLLMRDGDGDRARARRALGAVLDHQYDEPGQVWHGTFALVHEIPPPRPGARMWDDYDPNWRQFIGCTLVLALRQLGDRLPEDLLPRIERALRLAVEGEHAEADGRRIPDSYSNIALMAAYVEVEAGIRLGEPAWVAAGEDRGRRAIARHDRYGAFDEFNSPTYHGIDLLALGLWRGHSGSPVLAELGARVEAELWVESARWYHPGLRQVAGPYTRAYGMDLAEYVAAWSLWVWAGLGRAQAPLPDLDRPLAHGMDLLAGAVVALIGSVVPDEARALLTTFDGERSVQRRIGGGREATAWLGRDVAFGAERGPDDLSWWDQFHAATAHWQRADGSSGWLRARLPGPSDATVTPGRMVLRWHHEHEGEPRIELARPLDEDDPVVLERTEEGGVTTFVVRVR